MRNTSARERSSTSSTAGGLGVFVAGIVITVGFYAGLKALVPPDSLVVRYLSGHPVSYGETWMFLWGMLIVFAKGGSILRQRAALRREILPRWDGQPVPVENAATLVADLDRLPPGFKQSKLGGRVREALEFVRARHSTDGLDEYLTNQSVAAAEAVEGSYSLIRFITWAIPILGFLGTVFGINEALGNVTPEKLADSIAGVTDGLAVAFDTTAIALMYSIFLMFGTFLAERFEQGLLRGIDAVIEHELLNRFARTSLEEKTDPAQLALLRTVESLVERQAEIWSRTLDDMRGRYETAERQQMERLTATLSTAMEKTLTAYQTRLQAMERQMHDDLARQTAEANKIKSALASTAAALEKQSRAVAEQTAVLLQMHQSGTHLLQVQESLQSNLQAVANVGSFQEAVHSLAAAIHLLTARVPGRPAASGESTMIRGWPAGSGAANGAGGKAA
jgi:biopolymer transport protein ExbB/TolQ